MKSLEAIETKLPETTVSQEQFFQILDTEMCLHGRYRTQDQLPVHCILTPIFHPVSGLHVCIVHKLLPVSFHSVPSFIPSLNTVATSLLLSIFTAECLCHTGNHMGIYTLIVISVALTFKL